MKSLFMILPALFWGMKIGSVFVLYVLHTSTQYVMYGSMKEAYKVYSVLM